MSDVVNSLIAIEVESLAAMHNMLAVSKGMPPSADRDEIEKAIRQQLREEGFDV